MIPKEALIDEGREELEPSIADDLDTCLDCQEPSVIQATWLTSKGRQTAGFCSEHGKSWWTKWQHSPSGQTASFTDPPHVKKAKGAYA